MGGHFSPSHPKLVVCMGALFFGRPASAPRHSLNMVSMLFFAERIVDPRIASFPSTCS